MPSSAFVRTLILEPQSHRLRVPCRHKRLLLLCWQPQYTGCLCTTSHTLCHKLRGQRGNRLLLHYAASARLDTLDHRYTDNTICIKSNQSNTFSDLISAYCALSYTVSDLFGNIPDNMFHTSSLITLYNQGLEAARS